jgi:putative protease
MQQKNKIEILAPAGNFECVTAAVYNGADAVYLGQKAFNARQNAANFEGDAFLETVRFCHLYGVKVYQTLNTIVFDEEIPALKETIRTACKAGVDALIVQDFGVLRIVRTLCPDMRIHASTQMTVHTVGGAMLLKQLGVKRVVVARELNQNQIKQIIDQTGLEVEVFVHGALCMSVSGQCYMSAAIGGRSGNKGSCAGTCRLPFSAVRGKEQYDLSLKDSCLAAHFEELAEMGVTSLKIEGRMKRPEYVAAAVRAYTQLKEGKPADLHLLEAVFSRSGFTDGYFTGQVNGLMFGIRTKEDVLSATEEKLAQLRETYRKAPQIHPVSMKLRVLEGKPAELLMWDDSDTVTVTGEDGQRAKTRPLNEESAKESLQKLGGTPFYLSTFSCELEDNVMLPKSALNDLRRKAAEALREKIEQKREIEFFDQELTIPNGKRFGKGKLRAKFSAAAQIPWEMIDELEYCYLPVREVREHKEELLPYREQIILEPDRVLFGTEQRMAQWLQKLYAEGFTKLSVSNLSHIYLGQQIGFELYGTAFLNMTNSFSGAQYADLGLKEMTASFEMTAKQIRRLQTLMPLGMIAYGYLPLMIVKNCPVKRHVSCSECGGRQELTDRLGNRFRVFCHNREYSEILNTNCLWLSDKMAEFDRVDFAVLYFTVESKEECRQVIKRYQNRQKPEGNFTRGLYFRGIQ